MGTYNENKAWILRKGNWSDNFRNNLKIIYEYVQSIIVSLSYRTHDETRYLGIAPVWEWYLTGYHQIPEFHTRDIYPTCDIVRTNWMKLTSATMGAYKELRSIIDGPWSEFHITWTSINQRGKPTTQCTHISSAWLRNYLQTEWVTFILININYTRYVVVTRRLDTKCRYWKVMWCDYKPRWDRLLWLKTSVIFLNLRSKFWYLSVGVDGRKI
jgi:hypothetical protein